MMATAAKTLLIKRTAVLLNFIAISVKFGHFA